MKIDNNFPARLYRTTQTHNFQNLKDINVVNLKS